MLVSRSFFALLVSVASIALARAAHTDDENDYAHKWRFEKRGRWTGINDDPYCDLEPTGMHTMCVYEGPDEDNCQFVWSGLDDEGRSSILDMHNKLRNLQAGGTEDPHIPAASNMRKMEWNYELEEIAQMWAAQCHTQEHFHDENRNKLDGTYVGQNVEVMGKMGEDPDYYGDYGDYYDYYDYDREINPYIDITDEYFDKMMKVMGNQTTSWYKEQQYFDISQEDISIEKYVFHHNTGHYTQMIWAKTWEVGCGWALIKDEVQEKPGMVTYSSLLVCNYSPGGNFEDHPVYKEGDPATECGDGFSPDDFYTNLCKADDDEDDQLFEEFNHEHEYDDEADDDEEYY